MHRLVPALVAEMGAAYPELVRAQPLIEATLQQEETRFRQTLANGLKLLDEATADMAEGGDAARRDRVQALRHLRLPLRPDRGRAARPRPRRRPRRLRRRDGGAEGRRPRRLEGLGRQGLRRGLVRPRRGAWRDRIHRLFGRRRRGRGPRDRQGRRARSSSAEEGDKVQLLLNQTPFYGESGGQVGDAGKLTSVSKASKAMLRTRRSRSAASTRSPPRSSRASVTVGDTLHQTVDAERRDRDPRQPQRDPPAPRRAAQPARRPCHAEGQPGRARPLPLRFLAPQGAEPRRRSPQIEADVNAEIRANEPVGTRLMTPDDAVAAGAMALFGEKYGDEVRVLSDGPRHRPALFGRAVRRHPCQTRTGDIAICSRSSPKARSPPASAGSRR